MDLESIRELHTTYYSLGHKPYTQTHEGCNVCWLMDEVEKLKAENETIREWRVLLITERDKLREALDGAGDMIDRHGGDASFIVEALKDSPK